MARPLPATISTVSGTPSNLANLLTPDPKEVATFNSGVTWSFDLDLGAVKSVDTAFLGYMSGPAPFFVSFGTAQGGADVAQIVVTPQASTLVEPIYHGAYVLNAPVNARWIRFSPTVVPAVAGTLGVAAVGLSIQPTWGHEFGSGRPVEDTGTVERLFSGGFGIYEGVRVGGYQWTFGDLSDAEIQALYALARDRGTTRSVLVIEDPDQTDGLNERVHWSLFDRLEVYERQAPGASRYAFKVRDWA
jgi:hypothetical protein